MNATITIKKRIYPASSFRATGTAFSSTIAIEGKSFSTPPQTGLHRDGTLAEEIDRAFRRFVEVQLNSQTPADVTVELPDGYALSTALQQHYADKYSIEPEIKSVSFA